MFFLLYKIIEKLDSRFQISDFRFQISDFRFQISDFRFQIKNVKHPCIKKNGNLLIYREVSVFLLTANC